MRAVRYSLKALLALPVVVALAYWIVLLGFYSKRYYVLSNLHIVGWDLNRMGVEELNKRIPYLPSPEESKEDELAKFVEAYPLEHQIDGVIISTQFSCVAFSKVSTQWNHKNAVKDVHKQMREFLDRNLDLVPTGATVTIYALEPDYRYGSGHAKKHQVSNFRFETYPPKQQSGQEFRQPRVLPGAFRAITAMGTAALLVRVC